MVATTELSITKDWLKVSDTDCTLQYTGTGVYFDVAVTTTTPSTASLSLSLLEPITLAYKTPVWCRISQGSNMPSSVNATIIK